MSTSRDDKRDASDAPAVVWVAKGRISGYWEYVSTRNQGEKDGWQRYVRADLASAPSHVARHPDGDKICPECGGRLSACNVLGHRPESDRHIQWQTTPSTTPQTHVCGLQGFGAAGDSCPACAWDPKAEFHGLGFASYTDAKKAEVLFNRLMLASAVSATPLFTLEVCEELFGCHVSPSGERGFECAICDKNIDIKAWVHAEHEPDCVINRVRDYLATHKPEVVRSRGVDWMRAADGGKETNG